MSADARETVEKLREVIRHANTGAALTGWHIERIEEAASALDAKGETPDVAPASERANRYYSELLRRDIECSECRARSFQEPAAPPLAPSLEGGWQPIDQTKFGYPEGNCLAACLASFFKLRLEDLPDLNDVERSGGDWWKALCDICVPRGFRITHALASFYPCPPKGLHIAGGKSPRGDFDHVVLVEDGVVVHDPHPSRAGLRTHEDYYLMIPMAESPRSVAQSVQEDAVFINNEQTEKLNASAPREPQPSSEPAHVVEMVNGWPRVVFCPHEPREPREPHAALVKEIDATLAMVNEDGRGHCQLCEHPPVTGEVVEEQHYNDCLFFTLRRCRAALGEKG